MNSIFISYSHRDERYCLKLAEYLEIHGFSIFIDRQTISEKTWLRESHKSLNECSVLIVIMTENSFDSERVQFVLNRAKRMGKEIFPLLLKGNRPWLSVLLQQYVDVRNNKLPPPHFLDRLSKVAQRAHQKKLDKSNSKRPKGLFRNTSFHFGKRKQGFEILESTVVWNIISRKGSKKRHTRKVKALEHNLSTLREYIWESNIDGLNTDELNVHPGKIGDIYKQGSRYVIVIFLDRPYNRGEILDFTFEQNLRKSFATSKEWVEFHISAITRSQKIIINFPRERYPIRAHALEIHGDFHEYFEIGSNGFFADEIDDKMQLVWVIQNPIFAASYLIEWEW